MISQTDWESRDAVGLAALVAGGEVSAREVVETAIARIEALNPLVNAVIHTCYEEALAGLDAGTEPGPFHGVPYLIKDLHAPVKGVPLTNGSRFFQGMVFDFDSNLVARLRRAGFVFLGRTNSPELGLSASTEPRAYGPTRNPWNRERIAGGSSGGAGAAVASGMLPAAHATDSAGSIRIPASANGLVGLKPTRGLNPYGPHRGDGNHGISHEHAVTRTVRDCAAILDVTSGPDTGAPFFSPRPQRPFADLIGEAPRRLRAGFLDSHFDGTPVDPECAAAVRDTAALLAEAGHVVEEAKPEFDYAALIDAMMLVLMGGLAPLADMWAKQRGRPIEADDLEPQSHAVLDRSRATTLAAYVGAMAVMNREVRRLAAFFDSHDILVTPTLTTPPPRLGVLSTEETDVDVFLGRLFGVAPFAGPFNATGQPAISLPLAWSTDGLPIGVQVVGRYGEDATLLQLAAQLEALRPWFDRRPSLNPAPA
ncbi:amidase [Microbaculum marinum]|uniref:Indoleacetamide hydrolase n=1 Tax=Microbaculum marinum TaxID=1764581 RepID=A0AAW9RLW9_9HYPH